MIHKAWHSIEEVPQSFLGLLYYLQVTWVQKINDLNPILSKNTRPVAAIKSLRFALFIVIHLLWIMYAINTGQWMESLHIWHMGRDSEMSKNWFNFSAHDLFDLYIVRKLFLSLD